MSLLYLQDPSGGYAYPIVSEGDGAPDVAAEFCWVAVDAATTTFAAIFVWKEDEGDPATEDALDDSCVNQAVELGAMGNYM